MKFKILGSSRNFETFIGLLSLFLIISFKLPQKKRPLGFEWYPRKHPVDVSSRNMAMDEAAPYLKFPQRNADATI